MSIREVTYYQAACDWPGCVATPHPEYAAWSDTDGVQQDLDDAGWWAGRAGETHYCNEHPTFWASDHENKDSLPEPPYLLIHDGDTNDPTNDGLVSRIVALPAEAAR